MGQRSQIYINRIDELNESNLLVANYYQWNYGERMISRARYGLEYLKYCVDNKYNWVFKSPHDLEKIKRYFDVNFDFKDIAMSCDILKDFEEDRKDDTNLDFNNYVFMGQDNNDGKLFILIKDNKIKYCFTDCDCTKPLTATGYMNWDMEMWQDNKQYRLDEEQYKNLLDNLKEIETFELMTQDELNEFLTDMYDKPKF